MRSPRRDLRLIDSRAGESLVMAGAGEVRVAVRVRRIGSVVGLERERRSRMTPASPVQRPASDDVADPGGKLAIVSGRETGDSHITRSGEVDEGGIGSVRVRGMETIHGIAVRDGEPGVLRSARRERDVERIVAVEIVLVEIEPGNAAGDRPPSPSRRCCAPSASSER